MKVAIVGSRNCENLTWEEMVPHIPRNCSLLLSGGADGVDTLAKRLSKELDIPLKEILPDFSKYGHRAPLERSTQIVMEADMVLAFWNMTSRGTAHTLSECIRLQVPMRIIPTHKVDDHSFKQTDSAHS